MRIFSRKSIHRALCGGVILTALLRPALGVGQASSTGAAPPAAAPIPQLPAVEVVGATPLPALGTPAEKYPGNVQTVSPEGPASRRSVDVTDALDRGLGTVGIDATQSNPWQNDLTYRGFVASPLTGTPIGLSVYLDGLRFNDGFGDTVNWDLLPQIALAGIDVIPGSNPIFGLNTLGGALAVRTKDGRDFPGLTVGVQGGSFGRRAIEAEYGGFHGPFDWYLAANLLEEDGWRAQSPTDLRQVFSKVGWQSGGSALNLSYGYADNDLVGNGLAPESLLAADRDAVYTFPDHTRNRMHLLHLSGSRWLTGDLLLSADAFYRNYLRTTYNGDAEIHCVDGASGEEAFDAQGRPVHLGQCQGSSAGDVDGDGHPLAGELEREAEGEDHTTRTATQDWGGTVQLSSKGPVAGHGNRVTWGVAYDRHTTQFTQSTADSDLVPQGHSVGTVRTGDFATDTDVHTSQDNLGTYLTDTFDLTDRLALTLAGRLQHVRIAIQDLTGQNPALDGEHSFDRFSPAAGLAFEVLPHLITFASYSEGFRAPTAAELTCADPDAPCKLPNAFIADPPLKPVVARTYEIGARGRLPVGDALQWSLGLFRTDLHDDILFTVVEAGGAGFFQNVDQTRRQGVELGVKGLWDRLEYFVSYAYIDATYQSATTLASVVDAAGVQVAPGDRIPGIPRHNLKLGAELALLDNLWLGADVIVTSSSYLRGDDGNQSAPLDGYAVLNLDARYQPVQHLEVWASLDNVTNTRYATEGALNFNAFANPIAVERFVAPGAPIAGWLGARVHF
jgi:outer membrane receptor protein involved in Fe transport